MGRFVTFGRRDAAVEPTGMYPRRVTKRPTCLEGGPDDQYRTSKLTGNSEQLFRSYNMIGLHEIEAVLIEAFTPNDLHALTRSPGTNAVPRPSALGPRH